MNTLNFSFLICKVGMSSNLELKEQEYLVQLKQVQSSTQYLGQNMYSMNVKYYNLVSNIYGIDYSKEPLQ